MNCVNCHRPMNLITPVQYNCPFCGVNAFKNVNESALVGVAWVDQAPCFWPIGPPGANVPFAAPKPVMKFPTTSCPGWNGNWLGPPPITPVTPPNGNGNGEL